MQQLGYSSDASVTSPLPLAISRELAPGLWDIIVQQITECEEEINYDMLNTQGKCPALQNDNDNDTTMTTTMTTTVIMIMTHP